MAKPGVMFYFDVRQCIKRLDTNEKGRLFEAILDYAEFGIVPDLDGALGVAWDFIQPKLDRDAGRYDRQVEQKQYAVFVRELRKKGGNPIPFDEWKSLPDIERNRMISADTGRYPTSTNNLQTTTPNLQTTTSTDNRIGADKPPARTRFLPPKVEEVRAYCHEQGYTRVDPERFIDYYQSNGWKVGKNPMKDWKAAVRGWNGRDKDKDGQNCGQSLLGYTEENDNWTL